MLDSSLRRHLDQPLARIGRAIGNAGVSPTTLTALGLLIGVGACAAIANRMWALALVLWLLNRTVDGLDGAVARNGPVGPTDLGGFYDIMADFAIYGGVLAAVGYALPQARVAALVLFLGYYLNGTAFLAWSSLATRREIRGDGRSLVFPAGLAEGTETIAVYTLLLAIPAWAVGILWLWAGVVFVTVGQRIWFVRGMLADDPLVDQEG